MEDDKVATNNEKGVFVLKNEKFSKILSFTKVLENSNWNSESIGCSAYNPINGECIGSNKQCDLCYNYNTLEEGK